MEAIDPKTLQTPFHLAALIDYSPSAIVSRAIVKANEGNITLFAFAQGEQLSPHSAPFDAFLQVLDGKTLVTIGDKEQTLTGGEAIMLPANIPHAVHAEENMKMLLVMIKAKN